MSEDQKIDVETTEEEVVEKHVCNESCEDPCPDRPKRKYVRKDPTKKIKRKRSAEHNAKIAEALRGRSLDPAHRDAIAQSMIGNQNRGKS